MLLKWANLGIEGAFNKRSTKGEQLAMYVQFAASELRMPY